MTSDIEKQATHFLNTALKVITTPVPFFRQMPKTGGLVQPMIFMVVMGVATGILQSILALFGLGMAASFMMALATIILMPIMIVIFGFVGAGIMYLIWNALGSSESYETAYRCTAYASAITPITALLAIIPFLGSILGFVWMLYLMVIASTEVHKIEPRKAWIAFGILFGILALMTTCSQIASRRIQSEMGDFQKRMEEMTPEETGEAVGKFMKGLQKAAEKEE